MSNPANVIFVHMVVEWAYFHYADDNVLQAWAVRVVVQNQSSILRPLGTPEWRGPHSWIQSTQVVMQSVQVLKILNATLVRAANNYLQDPFKVIRRLAKKIPGHNNAPKKRGAEELNPQREPDLKKKSMCSTTITQRATFSPGNCCMEHHKSGHHCQELPQD